MTSTSACPRKSSPNSGSPRRRSTATASPSAAAAGRLRNDENTKRNVRPEQHEASLAPSSTVPMQTTSGSTDSSSIVNSRAKPSASRYRSRTTSLPRPRCTRWQPPCTWGFAHYFHGSVDHLRIVPMVEHKLDHIARRYILIHDTVPGGTGYLKELLRQGQPLYAPTDRLQGHHRMRLRQRGRMLSVRLPAPRQQYPPLHLEVRRHPRARPHPCTAGFRCSHFVRR